MKKPNSWADITIKQFNECSSIIQSETLDDLTKNIYLISILCGISKKETESIEVNKFLSLAKELSSLVASPTPKQLFKEFTIDKVVYKYNYARPIQTAGQYISLMELGKKENNPAANFHKIMAVLCEPEEGITQSYQERVDIFYKNLTMDKVFPITLFFSQLFPKLTQTMTDCLMKEARMQTMELKAEVAHFKRIGDGLKLLPPVLRRAVKRGIKWKDGE